MPARIRAAALCLLPQLSIVAALHAAPAWCPRGHASARARSAVMESSVAITDDALTATAPATTAVRKPDLSKERKPDPSKEISRSLAAAKDNEAILSIVDDKFDALNGINAAMALHRLAMINKRQRVSRDALLRDSRYQQRVIPAAIKQHKRFNARSATDVLWSCATLQDWPPELLMPALTAVALNLDKEAYNGGQLCMTVWSLGKLVDLKLTTMRPTKLLERIEVQAAARLTEMNIQNVANLMWGFSKMKYFPTEVLKQLPDALKSSGIVDGAKAVEVTDLTFALGEFGEVDRKESTELMLALAQRASPDAGQFEQFSSRQLVKLIAAHAKLGMTNKLPDGLHDAWISTVKREHSAKPLMARDSDALERVLDGLGIDSSWIKNAVVLSAWALLADGGTTVYQWRRAFSEPELRRVFDAIDTDGSGDIDMDELRQAIQLVRGEEIDDEVLKKMIKFGDTDGDAEVSFDEFKAIILGTGKSAGA